MNNEEKKEIIGLIKEAVEQGIQQRSGSHSDLLREIMELKKDMAGLKDTINGWRSGTKLAFWIFVYSGALVTWVLNTTGVRIGIKY